MRSKRRRFNAAQASRQKAVAFKGIPRTAKDDAVRMKNDNNNYDNKHGS